MEIVRQLDERLWREFVYSHPQSNIFHVPEMFQVFSRAKNHQPELWAATQGERVLALLLPVRIDLLGGLFRFLSTRAVVYGGVLCAPGGEGQEALTTLLQAYNRGVKSSVLFTELRNLSDWGDLQPVLSDNGFVYEDHLNYLIDLRRHPEAVLQGIGPRTRKKIRHALRQGRVVIEEARQREQVMTCYQLMRDTYSSARIPLADCSLFEAAFQVLYPQGMAKFLLARVGDHYAASSVELIYRDEIYGWYSGLDRTYANYIPNELLLWHVFQWGAEHGYHVYDFGGAGRPNEEYGVRDFKAKFGGSLVCYGRNISVHSHASFQLSRWAYKVYRQLL